MHRLKSKEGITMTITESPVKTTSKIPIKDQLLIAKAQKYGKRVHYDPEKYEEYLEKRRARAGKRHSNRKYVTENEEKVIYSELKTIIKHHTSTKFLLIKNLKCDISTDKPTDIHAGIKTLRDMTPAMLQYWILRYFHDQGFEKRSKHGAW